MYRPLSTSTRFLSFIPWLVFLICALFLANGHANDKRDILLGIVKQCLNTQEADYCNQCLTPRKEIACQGKDTCKTTIDVWSENEVFVAMRDIKMCGCDADFVHALVIPKNKVTGVEDANRPEAIWAYAWNEAMLRITKSEIALAVNPRFKRSQDQLHVHIVRLRPDAKSLMDQASLTKTPDLNSVWAIAQQAATQLQFPDYGVLVFAASGGGFNVLVTQGNAEHMYTQVRCSP